MIKQLISIITSLILAFPLICCGVPSTQDIETAEIEYIRLAPQEAREMMSDDVIILDVRTQEEFDVGHIINAILLPDYEIQEKAEDILMDKYQTILIYCRSGRRSEAAARQLIDMGYTQVFDFGGILDWPGEIILP